MLSGEEQHLERAHVEFRAMAKSVRTVTGCGCGLAVALIAVIIGVGLLVQLMGVPVPLQPRLPIPDDVPPAAAEPAPKIDTNAPGRTSDKLGFWADPLAKDLGFSSAALRAYGNAEIIANESYPDCHLSWNTLAGIGFVETRHGTYTGRIFDGAAIDENGFVQPAIFGPQLDGNSGFALVKDTDNGEMDGDAELDRAVGPLQFIPETWRRFSRDADGDGVPNPQQIDDAALTTAVMLCANGGDLSTPEGWTKAVRSYNQSTEYVMSVRDAAASYALGQPAFKDGAISNIF